VAAPKRFFTRTTTTMTTDVAGPIGAEVAHVPTENNRGSIKDGAIDFIAGSLGNFRDS